MADKQDVPPRLARHYLEPGPVVLLSSRYDGTDNVMTLGWHQILAFSPSLVSCMISHGNHSHDMIRQSGECVINIPDSAMIDTVVGIGNCSGADTDKFASFDLAREPSQKVDAPRVAPCWAHLECRLHDRSMIEDYGLFVFEVVAIAAMTGTRPQTVHYLGDGQFQRSGDTIDRRDLFKPSMLP